MSGYRQEIERGERCLKCGCLTGLYFLGPHKPRLCYQCEALAKPERCLHDAYVRCPACGVAWMPLESEVVGIYRGGDAAVSCQSCGHDFEVMVLVSYSFESPPLNPREGL